MDAVLKMRMALGAAGYGVYVQLLELLRDADGYTAAFDAQVLAWALHESDPKLVERVVTEFGLFQIGEDGRFSSPWLSAAMSEHDERRAKYAAAGRKSAAIRASKAEQSQATPEGGCNDVATTLPPPLEGGCNDVGNLSQQTKKTNKTKKNLKNTPPLNGGGGEGDLYSEEKVAALERVPGIPWRSDLHASELIKDATHNPLPLYRIAEHWRLSHTQVLHLACCCNSCEIGSAPFVALLAADRHCTDTGFAPKLPFSYFVSRIKAAVV